MTTAPASSLPTLGLIGLVAMGEPLTEILYHFCDRGERVVVDDHRLAPSFWHELLQ